MKHLLDFGTRAYTLRIYIYACVLLQRTERQTHQQYYEYQQPYELQQATARQGDDGLITTVISLALKYGPTLFNYVLGGGSSAQQQTTDRIEELEIKVGCLLFPTLECRKHTNFFVKATN